LSDNPLSKTSNERKDFLASFKEYLKGSKDTLTLLDLSNMFLGFEIVLEIVTNCLSPLLLSLDLAGNQLTDPQIDIIKHCLGIK
jgi:hypothetical protein